jgi:hypothetical protein
MMKFVKLTLLFLSIVITLNAQIPNVGFENWIDEYTPQDWQTSNVFQLGWYTVTRSSTAYTGSYAARLEIKDSNGGFLLPSIMITFPVDHFDQTLNGYYQFYPTNNNVVLTIAAYYFVNGLATGAGSIDIETGVSSYTYFSFDPSIGNESVAPDSIRILFNIFDGTFSSSSIGSYALIDQLSLGGTSEVEQINHNPSDYSLKQNFPNPFNPSTTIEFSIPQELFVQLKVFDILGNEVATLANENYPAGNYKADFNGDNLPSGFYIARMTAGDFIQTRKMILLK